MNGQARAQCLAQTCQIRKRDLSSGTFIELYVSVFALTIEFFFCLFINFDDSFCTGYPGRFDKSQYDLQVSLFFEFPATGGLKLLNAATKQIKRPKKETSFKKAKRKKRILNPMKETAHLQRNSFGYPLLWFGYPKRQLRISIKSIKSKVSDILNLNFGFLWIRWIQMDIHK